MTQQKKWVFTELVTNTDDPEQLIAYAMYKADKDDHAESCRRRLMTEIQIAKELTRFHDGVAHSERQLRGYRDKAERAVDGLTNTISQRIENIYEAEIAIIRQAHEETFDTVLENHQTTLDSMTRQYQAALKQQWEQWGKEAANYSAHLTKPHWWTRTWKGTLKWLGGGVSGLLATVVTTFILVAVISIAKPGIRDTARDSLKGAVDTLIPATPIPGVTDAGPKDETKQLQ